MDWKPTPPKPQDYPRMFGLPTLDEIEQSVRKELAAYLEFPHNHELRGKQRLVALRNNFHFLSEFLEQRLNTMTTELTQLKADVAALTADTTNKLAEKDARIKALTDQLNAAQGQVTTLTAQLANVDNPTDITAVDADVKALDAQVQASTTA